MKHMLNKKNKIELFSLAKEILKGNYKTLLIILISFAIMSGIQPIIIPYILNNIFTALSKNDIHLALMICFRSLIYISIYILLYYIITVYPDAWMTKITNKGMINIFRKIFRLSYWKIDKKYSNGDLRNRIDAACKSIIMFFLIPTKIIASVCGIIYLFVMAVKITWFLPVVVFLMVVIDMIILKIQYKKNVQYIKKENELQGSTDETIKDITNNIEFLITHKIQDQVEDIYFDKRNNLYKIYKNKMVFGIVASGISSLVSELCKVFLSIVMMPYRVTNLISVGQVGSSFQIFDNMRGKANELRSDIFSLPNSMVPINRLNEVLDNKMDSLKECGNSDINTINIENISFCYKDKLILNQISLKIFRGEKVCIIGKNGCGKSTLLRIIAGLYNPVEGRIQIYNIDSKNLDYSDRRKLITYIPTVDQLFTGITQSNVLYNADDCEEIQLNNILECSWIKNFAFKSTKELSGGEKKRVNVARGLIHKVPILLADEPTSSLDIFNGEQIIKTVIDSCETCIIITHNPNYLRYFDRIIIIDKNGIAGNGCFNDIEKLEAYREWLKNEG